MWIVRVALQRPYTFIVMALVLLMLGPVTLIRTPVDVFPNIGIPVISIIYRYNGFSPADMSNRIIFQMERYVTLSVNDIEHIESQSLIGIGIIKIFFRPGVDISTAMAAVSAGAQSGLSQMPPGTQPPFILSYNASSVPILQLALSSETIPEQNIFDFGQNFIRQQLATVHGAAMPFPYGGRIRQIQIDLDQSAMRAKGLSASDINNAITAQNLIIPAGTEKIGDIEYNVELNGSPAIVDQLNDIPVKTVNGAMVFMRDVAHVRDGFSPQTNIVRLDGKRGVLMTVQKIGSTSTLDIINDIKANLPLIRARAPAGLNVSAVSDQSLFVEAAVNGVVREGIIAAALTGLMILLFLGSWRSTLIITISIPLSVVSSIIALSALGETINIMTLGGLALAVGILVDDATVTIENINWHLEHGEDVETAILEGARQIALPALVSTLSICIVFLPMFFLAGIPRYLFVPLAEAVIFAMLASYILSRTLVPTLAKYWLQRHQEAAPRGRLAYFQRRFEAIFEHVRLRYRTLLGMALLNRRPFAAIFAAAIVASAGLAPFIGSDFFPHIDGGQIKLHIRGRSGTRVEQTTRICDSIEGAIRELIPAAEIESIADNIGLPNSGINLSYSNSAPVGPADADIMITLVQGHKPTADYVRSLREVLPRRFPDVEFASLPADIVSQILNFGLPAPIDIQISGPNEGANRKYAAEVLAQLQRIPGIADAHIHQLANHPDIQVAVDRSRAQDLGLTQRDVASALLVTLSGSFQTSPNFWLNPKTGVSYPIAVQAPQYRMDSLSQLQNLPLTNVANPNAPPQLLGAVANFSRTMSPAVVTHYNTQMTVDIFAAVQDRDLGAVAARINRILADTAKDVPKGSLVISRGQVQTMQSAFSELYLGLAFAIVLVYFLIVVNFQSWVDPLIIICALPGALAGIAWMLFITHTTVSVPALTGAIMCMGVATANSILVVSFARERMRHGRDPLTAALEAGFTRFRPVLMTALAMIIGMVPMALGIGQGSEQNAPLGRSVIGGLLFATVATLFFVPTVFTLVHERLVSRKHRHSAV